MNDFNVGDIIVFRSYGANNYIGRVDSIRSDGYAVEYLGDNPSVVYVSRKRVLYGIVELLDELVAL